MRLRPIALPAKGEDGLLCLFEEEFAPGSTFRVPAASPVKIRVNKDAGGPYTYGAAAVAVGVTADDAAVLARKKTGRVLSLDALTKASDLEDDAESDINPEDNIAVFGVSVGKSVADSAAIGASFQGAVGDTSTVEVGLHNLGPTSVITSSDDLTWLPSVHVTIPAGVKLTEVAFDCLPGDDVAGWDFANAGTVDGLDYTCFPEMGAQVGEKVTFAFTGELTGAKSAAGSAVVDGGVQDANAKNDRAAISIALTGDGSGGQGGGLPITGTPTGWVAIGGAVLLLAGAVAAFVFRRRRVVTTL